MVPAKGTKLVTHTVAFTQEDLKILNALRKKKGGTVPSVIREALRVLATKEELSYA